MRGVLSLLFVGLSSSVFAHEQTPAYPSLEPSYVDGIYKTSLTLFNRRNDVEYYEIRVFDREWNPILFAAESRLLELRYLEKKSFDVYIRRKDIDKVKYVCTQSKLIKEDATAAVVASRICSKIK